MTSILRGPFKLPEDLNIQPVKDLPENLRSSLDGAKTDFTISRPGSRQTSKLISPETAEILNKFSTPQTIVQAVATYSVKNNLNPEATLLEVLPILGQFIAAGLLIPEDTSEADKIAPTFEPDDIVGGYATLDCLQVLEDSELYLVKDSTGNHAVLKIARKGKEEIMRARIEREAQILDFLDDRFTPKLLEVGNYAECPYLIMSWKAGVDAVTAGAEYRDLDDYTALLQLLVNIAQAYSRLHELGVLHGDIHPGNVLVGMDNEIVLIDFGLAYFDKTDCAPAPRGGVSFFCDPEYASAILEKQSPPQITSVAEQYSIATLLYLIATGHHYADFSLESKTMYAQVLNEPPIPFAKRNLPAWPDLEKVLKRALSKDPQKRYGKTAELVDALSSVQNISSNSFPSKRQKFQNFLDQILDELQPENSWFCNGLDCAPYCSVHSGMAGIAYSLLRIASAVEDPQLLALADVWLNKAMGAMNAEGAFYSDEQDLGPETLGHISPYHTASGLFLVHALLADSSGNKAEAEWAQEAYFAEIEKTDTQDKNRDLTLGRLGTVLGSAILLDKSPDNGSVSCGKLKIYGDTTLDEIWDTVRSFDSIETGRNWANIGIAHGWGGLLYTTLRWHQCTGYPIPEEFIQRYTELRQCAYPEARGLSWPWRAENGGGKSSMPGWCNGAAGLVHLGTLAYRIFGEEHFLVMAEGAAWHAWEAPGSPIDLCCGLAGRSYALLNLYQHTGETAWLQRARELAGRAVSGKTGQPGPDNPRHSLYKGELGLAVLVAELETPKSGSMPMFGMEV